MGAAVANKIRLDYPVKGVTLRKQLEQVEKSSGIHDSQLDSVVVPEEGEWLWGTYWMLSGKITYQEVDAYCRLNDLTLKSWELEALFYMESQLNGAITELIDAN